MKINLRVSHCATELQLSACLSQGWFQVQGHLQPPTHEHVTRFEPITRRQISGKEEGNGGNKSAGEDKEDQEIRPCVVLPLAEIVHWTK